MKRKFDGIIAATFLTEMASFIVHALTLLFDAVTAALPAGCRFPTCRKEYEMENKSDNSKGGIGFAGALQIAFIVLKLCRVIDWPWILVLTPIWVILALIIIGFVIITAVIKRRRNK